MLLQATLKETADELYVLLEEECEGLESGEVEVQDLSVIEDFFKARGYTGDENDLTAFCHALFEDYFMGILDPSALPELISAGPDSQGILLIHLINGVWNAWGGNQEQAGPDIVRVAVALFHDSHLIQILQREGYTLPEFADAVGKMAIKLYYDDTTTVLREAYVVLAEKGLLSGEQGNYNYNRVAKFLLEVPPEKRAVVWQAYYSQNEFTQASFDKFLTSYPVPSLPHLWR